MSALKRNCILLLLVLVGEFGIESHGSDSEPVHYVLCEDDDRESLETITSRLTKGANVHIDINTPYLHLNESISFTQLSSLTISGDSNSATIINCTQLDAGITLNEIMNLTLNDLILTYCGSPLKMRNKTYSSALTVCNCSYVDITNLVITKSRGIGLTILNHQEGIVHIALSNFTDNIAPKEEDGVSKILGGGGVYVGEFQQNSQLPISFEFENCIFDKNVACTRQYNSFYTDEFGRNRSGCGRGGGVFVALDNEMKHSCVNITFSYCSFTNNHAFLGGGLSVTIGRGRKIIETNITVTVEDSVFESNGCSDVTRIGGGAHLSYNSESLSKFGNEYNIRNVNFTNNCAELGGGVYFFSHKQKSSDNSLLFDNCIFERNKAHTGSAIDMTPNIFTRLSTGHTIIVPVFRNCQFVCNKVLVNSQSPDTQEIAGTGTLYASLYDIKFEGENHFEYNEGTAVYVVNGIADFSHSSAFFNSNQGRRGGAIALIGASSMIVGPNREYSFENNTALYQGGAIFTLMIDSHDFTVSKSCFIQYFNGKRIKQTTFWNNTITFTGNKAPLGRAIFATSLHSCQILKNDSHYITVDTSEVFLSRGIDISEREVATEGAQFHHEHTERLNTIPGKPFEHGVTVMDDTNKTVNEPLRTNIVDGLSVKLDPDLSSYVGKTILLRGLPRDKANLSLQTVSTRQSYTTLEVELEECPPGFKLEIDKCVCDANKYFGLLDCDRNNFQSYLTPGFWAGLISTSDKEMVISICPHSFCDYKQSYEDNQTTALHNKGVALPHWNKSQLDEIVCGETRTGILCGNCRQGYTVPFHSPRFRCKPTDQTQCKVGWLFYILSELVPVTAVFITVLTLNINFTSGAVNGFILFSQVLLSLNIDASGIITFPNQRAIIEGYQLLYGFLNLDFFTTESMSFCLWPNATALDMLAFKYITIVYALSLVILVIWFINKYGGKCLGKLWRITTVKSSVIHGISAFLIICYSQSVVVSHSLVNRAELWHKEGSNMTATKRSRVWLNGNIPYFSARHLPYALPALFCLLTIGVLPPVLLLVYPLFNKVIALLGFEESKVVNFISQKVLYINSLKPLLDSFQGCFKDNLRFFAGLYFLYRWIAPVVFTISSGLGTAYVTTEILLVLMLAIHAFSQPYLQRVHNMVDTVLFTDLLLINSITCIHYFLFQSQENRYTVKKRVAKTAIIQAILIYLPFCVMVIYVLALGYKHICGFYKKCDTFNHERMDLPATQTLGRLRAAVHSISSISGDTSNTDEELPHRLIAGQVSYECFEDTDRARETYVETNLVQDIVTY